jgi:hypothetical protein
MSKTYYTHKRYPLQDGVLGKVATLQTPFYLTGGTALSRCYLHHRYSDDLDFFTNDHPDFLHHARRIFDDLSATFSVRQTVADEGFVQFFVTDDNTDLKIECINDVSYHFGEFHIFQNCKTDNPLNILSNKLSALSRDAAKDYADILFLSQKYAFNWMEMVDHAKQKDTWVNELAIADLLHQFDVHQFGIINWINPVDLKIAKKSLESIALDILKGADNSICMVN